MIDVSKAMEKIKLDIWGDKELKKQLKQIDWPIEYGNIRIQLRDGKPTLITIERTVKLD